MYGLLVVDRYCTNPLDQAISASQLCAICHSLSRRYGHGFQIFANYDAAFVATLYAAQSGETGVNPNCHTSSCRLPGEITKGVRFASALSLVMAKAKALDDILDQNSIAARVLTRLISRKIPRAERDLEALGFRPQLIFSNIEQQEKLEKEGQSGLEELSGPTEKAVSEVFAHTAKISDNEKNLRPLSDIGRNVGKLMYLTDNYADLQEDLAHNRYNPFATLQKDGRSQLKDDLKRICLDSIARISHEMKNLRLVTLGKVVDDALVSSLTQQVQNLFSYERFLGTRRQFSPAEIVSIPALLGRYQCFPSCPSCPGQSECLPGISCCGAGSNRREP